MLNRNLGRDRPTISFPVSDGIRHRNYKNDTEVQLGTESSKESGMCSPPLWTRSPPRSSHHRKIHYRSLSPESKTQAIARGQRELMEMVNNMSESSYELTLKDLVEEEQPGVDVEEKNTLGEKNLYLSNKFACKREGVSSRKVDKGSGNIDSGGFYLKMVFPISLGSKKKKKKKKNESLGNNNNNCSVVSPRTSVSDKECWKKKSLSESDIGESSINSGSMNSSGSSSGHSSRSNSRHEMSASSCWAFIRRFNNLSQKKCA